MDRDDLEDQDPEESGTEAEAVPDETIEDDETVDDASAELARLRRDYEASSREGRRQAELVRMAQERERVLLQALQSSRQAPPPQPERYIPDLSALGIPEEAAPVLDRLIAERAREIGQRAAAEQVQAMMEPFLRAAEAQTHIDLELGDYPRKEIARYLSENPPVKERYDKLLLADPVGAAEWALLRYRQDSGQTAEAGMHAENAEARRMKQVARTQGRVTSAKTTRGTVGRESRENQEQERLQKLFEQARSGDPAAVEAYRRARLQSLPSLGRVDWQDEE